MKKLLGGLLLIIGFSVQAAQPVAPASAAATASKFPEVLATPAQLAALRKGGFTLYMRHGNTDNSRADQVPKVDLTDCNTQRVLNEKGRKVAAKVGAALKRANIPLGDVSSSPLCRAKDTTALVLGTNNFTLDAGLMYTANLTTEQKLPVIEKTRALLSQPVPAGKNRLVVAHAPNLMDMMGYFPKEGTIVIFRPRGPAGFEYVASIPPSLWGELLRQDQK